MLENNPMRRYFREMLRTALSSCCQILDTCLPAPRLCAPSRLSHPAPTHPPACLPAAACLLSAPCSCSHGGLHTGLVVELANGAMALVTSITDTTVNLDTNNMMAGKRLTFELEVMGIYNEEDLKTMAQAAFLAEALKAQAEGGNA